MDTYDGWMLSCHVWLASIGVHRLLKFSADFIAKQKLHGYETDRPTQKTRYPVKANSHRHAGHDKTVLSVSRPLRRCELDYRQLKTVADRKSEV